MKQLGNLGLFSLFIALLAMPLIGFGFMEYQAKPIIPSPYHNVLPAEDIREITEVSEATEASL